MEAGFACTIAERKQGLSCTTQHWPGGGEINNKIFQHLSSTVPRWLDSNTYFFYCMILAFPQLKRGFVFVISPQTMSDHVSILNPPFQLQLKISTESDRTNNQAVVRYTCKNHFSETLVAVRYQTTRKQSSNFQSCYQVFHL